MKRVLLGCLGLVVLGCAGVELPLASEPEPGAFAVSVAKMTAAESDDVECRLGRTNGGTITFLDWKYTFGDPEVRMYPDEMKSSSTRNGPRDYMMVIPVTLENTQPKKRAYDRSFKFHRPDGELYDARTRVPDWVQDILGKPNITTDTDPFAPGETRDGYVMLSVGSPTSPVGGVMRVYAKEKIPGTRLTRFTDHICVEVGETTEVADLVKPG